MLTGTEILTTAQMRAIESAAMDSGQVSGGTLMRRAGGAVVGQIRLRWPKPGRATILCGPGNNGGDGYVIARLLAHSGWVVRVLGLQNDPGLDAAEMKRQWREIGRILPLTLDELSAEPQTDLYVDAIFGTGLTRPPEGEIAAILGHLGRRAEDYRSKIVAVDGPSGLCLDSGVFLGSGQKPNEPCLKAAMTVAFDSPKPGHFLGRGPDACGTLIIEDIGLRAWHTSAFPRDDKEAWGDLRAIAPHLQRPHRPEDADEMRKRASWLTKRGSGGGHKFSHGHALILAGAVGHGGAARLSARAALRAGAGLVTICPPKSALIEHLGPPDALMRRALDDADQFAERLEDRRISGISIGPGCGVERAGIMLRPLLSSRRACVIDADAITALSRSGDLVAALHGDCVLTPHDGEFARLVPDIATRLQEPPTKGPVYSKLDAAKDAAVRTGAVVLLKGPDTVIASPKGEARIHSAYDIPWLATAGAGDVLAGIIAGLLARGLPAFEAAWIGVCLHAQAARSIGPGLIADDLPDALPSVLVRFDR